MNTLSAMGLAGALLLVASAPAMAQGYPVDPGYDQGPAYGQGEAPPEDLPPGAASGVDPAYGGPDQAYPEEDYGYGAPEGGPVYGGPVYGAVPGRRYRYPEQRRYGEDFRRGDTTFGRDQHRRVAEPSDRERRDGRDRNGEPRRHRQQPSNQDMPDR